MYNWKSELHSLLAGLARTQAANTLAEIQRILCGVLDLEEIVFLDRAGRELPEDLPFHDLSERAARVSLRLPYGRATGRESVAPSRFREGAPAADIQDIATDERYDRFVTEFLRLEHHHEFMWAGYIVRELIPRLGFAPEEAKLILDRLRADNLITITKVPNPKNPEFPATGVRLNREHPRVRAVLGEVTPEAHAVTDGT